MQYAVVPCRSPNRDARPAGVTVCCVVLHATGTEDTASAVQWCCTPGGASTGNDNPVSYHAIVGRDGTIYSLVDPAERAWHAGASEWRGMSACNRFSIGLSLCNRNDGIEPYPAAQRAAAAWLVARWILRYPAITVDAITTHADVSPGRKTDPRGLDIQGFRAHVALLLDGG